MTGVQTCALPILFGKHRQDRRVHEKMSDSDFMGEIARSRVTIKTLAESSPDAKGLGQFTAPSNFEVNSEMTSC